MLRATNLNRVTRTCSVNAELDNTIFIACAALPPSFTVKLRSLEADEGSRVTLRCETSKPLVPVEWKKGAQLLTYGQKYQLKQQACEIELLINQAEPEDSGDYSCVCGEQTTTACVKIKGMMNLY